VVRPRIGERCGDIDSFDPWIRPSDACHPLVRALSYFGVGLTRATPEAARAGCRRCRAARPAGPYALSRDLRDSPIVSSLSCCGSARAAPHHPSCPVAIPHTGRSRDTSFARAAVQDRRMPHPTCPVLHPAVGRKPVDSAPLCEDHPVHRAARPPNDSSRRRTGRLRAARQF
jgi:hypothetical protein